MQYSNQTFICRECGAVLTIPQNSEDGDGRFFVRCPNAECHTEYSQDEVDQILATANA